MGCLRAVASAVLAAMLTGTCGTPPPAPATNPGVTSSATPSPSPAPASTPAGITAKLTVSAVGLGPCQQPWWSPCVYGIRVEGPGGYDHRGSFDWDPGPPPSGEMGMGTAGPMASTGVLGDVPPALGLGTWTLSFRRYYASDVASYNPVPGGTPRYAEEDPFSAACSVNVVVDHDVSAVTVRVEFSGADCHAATVSERLPQPSSQAGVGARLTVDATGLGPCGFGFPYTCQYLIRLDGPEGQVDIAWFQWDYASPKPTASIGLYGDLPGRLPKGTWEFSFGGVLASDVVSFVPVPGATPRMMDLLPADVDCRTTVTVTDEVAVGVHVAFKAETCAATMEMATP